MVYGGNSYSLGCFQKLRTFYDALTEALQHDFDKAEKYLKDYDDLWEMAAATDPSASTVAEVWRLPLR